MKEGNQFPNLLSKPKRSNVKNVTSGTPNREGKEDRSFLIRHPGTVLGKKEKSPLSSSPEKPFHAVKTLYPKVDVKEIKEWADANKENTIKMLKSPKNWGFRAMFSRSNSPKLRRVDDMLKTNPFWENDFEYNFKIIDRTFFENYYCDESLVKENLRNKQFNEIEFEKYDVKMNQLVELIKNSKDCLVLKGRRLDEDFLKYFIKNSNMKITTQKLILHRNDLTVEGALLLLKKLNEMILVIDLSHNFIFPGGVDGLSRILTNTHTKLQQLILSNCKIKNETAKKLFFSILLNKTLQVLNLSHNQISDECSEHISMILQQKSTLAELYLNWNQLTSVTVIEIAECLKSNSYLKVLDLSFNKLGASSMDISCAPSIGEFLSKSSSLLHMDLSHTSFSLNESKIIAEGLQLNHSLYGFHFQGNPGKVDHLGNLLLEEESNEKCMSFAKTYFPINGIQPNKYADHKNEIGLRKKKGDSIDNVLSSAVNCWICEGWVEKSFEFTPQNKFNEAYDPNQKCFIHFEMDDWQPLEMGSLDGKFIFSRICPPRKIFFFFSYRGKQVVSRHHCSEKNLEPLIKINLNGVSKEFALPKLNYEKLVTNDKLLSKDYTVNVSQLPRKKFTTESKLFLDQIRKAKASNSNRDNSIFLAYEVDTEDLLNKSLDLDWKTCKFLRETKIPAESVKTLHDMVFSVYVYIKDCHKSYCTVDPIKRKFFVMSKSNFYIFINDLKAVFKLKLTQEEINYIYENSILTTIKKSWASNSLTRCEFLDVILRMANRIYFHEPQITSRFSNFLRDGLFVFLKDFHQQPMREEYLWSFCNEQALDSYSRLIKHVFQKYARTAYFNEKYGEFITIIEFHEIWRDCMESKGKDFISHVDIEKCFYLSQATQILDTYSKRHSVINFLEFLEAIIRIATKMKGDKPPLPRGSAMNSPSTNTRSFSSPKKNSVASSELSQSLRIDISPVHMKLEKLLWNMGDLVDDPSIQVNKPSIFDESKSVKSNSPRSPKRLLTVSPKQDQFISSPTILRSRTFELNTILLLQQQQQQQSRPIQVIKSKFNQLLGLAKLPLN